MVEMLVVIGLLALIVAIAVPLGLKVIQSSRAEYQMQSLYSNLVESRQRAVQNGFTYIVQVTKRSVDVYQDTNGNGLVDSGDPKVTVLSADWPKLTPFKYELAGNVAGTAIKTTVDPTTTFLMSRKGFATKAVTVYAALSGTTTVQDARLNCININYTRIGIGKYDTSSNTCKIQ